jgi:predicted aspartyl protease
LTEGSHLPQTAVGDSFFFPATEFDAEALLDTGFSGGLSVSPRLIPPAVSPVSQTIWKLADGSATIVDTYRGYVRIGTLPVVETEVITLHTQPLLGRSVMNHFRLLIIDHGNTITVEL